MKRTALYIGFPYTAGLLIASVVHCQLWFWVLGAALLIAAVLIGYRRSVWKYVLTSTLSLLTACCVYWCHDALSVQKQLAYVGAENTVFSGEITALTIHDSGYASYLLAGTLNGETPAKVKYFCNEPGYAFGDTLTLTGIPEAVESTYLFSAEEYYRSQGIFLSMPMESEVQHTPRTRTTFRSMLHAWRQEMTERIQKDRTEEHGALMTGMLFGDKSAMSDSTKLSLYRTGIGHVLAVSGLHLDFLALCVLRLLRLCKADRRISFSILAVLALLFVICVGETVSVKRACIMILISQSAGLFYRRGDMLNTISIAMLLLSLENPLVVHSAAFWLSFSGTFGIGVFAPYLTKPMPADTLFQRELRASARAGCVFLAVLPASMLYFREVSLISPLANLLLVPLCMGVLLLEALALLTGAEGALADCLLWTADRLAGLVLRISAYIADLPWTHAGTDSAVVLPLIAASALLITLCCLLWKSRRLMCAAIAVSLVSVCIAAGTERMYRSQNLRIAVLGESRDCALVFSLGSDAVIVDMSGDSSAPAYVSAYLQSTGIRSIEALFLCAPNQKNLTRYEEALRFVPPEQLTVMQLPGEENTLSSVQYTPDHAQLRELLFHGTVLTITEEHVRAQTADFTYVCAKEKTANIPVCSALTIYGTSRNVLPESGLLMVLDSRSCYTADPYTYVGKNNLELTIADDGQCSVRSLYADS